MTKVRATPAGLGPEGRALWKRLQADYVISDAAGIELLRNVCECRERITQMRKVVAKDGVLLADRFGQLRPHPALAIERDSRTNMLAALRGLRLSPGDVE